MSLPTPSKTVQKLQQSLHVKAKTEPSYRFYSLWDKVCRIDVLRHAYRGCRAKRGAPGVDGLTFEQIEASGLEEWLGNLQEELRSGAYAPQPLLASVDTEEKWWSSSTRNSDNPGPSGARVGAGCYRPHL